MWYILAAAFLLGYVNGDGHIQENLVMCRGTAKYRITFTTMWTEEYHMAANTPDSRGFSPITAASHSGEYQMWRPMLKASDGVKYVAGPGNNTILKNELYYQKMKGHVHDIFVADGPTGPATSSNDTYMDFTPEHHFGSMVSMTAPSPDWFTGIYNLDLCGTDTGKWMKKRSLNLYAWDAGTDSGKNFTSPDYPTDPVGVITLLEPGSDMYSSYFGKSDVPKFATIVFDLVSVTGGEKKPCMSESTENYHVTFQGMWTMESHPTDFPATAAFSPLVVASHNMDYTMWAPGGMSSPGVQAVAETGNPATLVAELNVANGVLDNMVPPNIPGTAPNGTMQTYIDVNKDHPYVSAVTMVFPSPDWFVGISSIDMCDEYFWKDGPVTFSLAPWDAGTDNGTTFLAPDAATMPHERISLITTDTMGAFYNRHRQHIPRLGTITLLRKIDAQRDYRNLVTQWKKAFSDFQMQFNEWKEDECPGGN
eukprot:m.2766 g.2766  ORF g.2766 m.2766 type:complete len:479 (+) comp8890_c0_seq1:102-1538(+)